MLETRNKQGKADVFGCKNERSYVSPMSLEIKKEKAKHGWLFLLIN